jgi:hypothetical protein
MKCEKVEKMIEWMEENKMDEIKNKMMGGWKKKYK